MVTDGVDRESEQGGNPVNRPKSPHQATRRKLAHEWSVAELLVCSIGVCLIRLERCYTARYDSAQSAERQFFTGILA